MNEEDYKMDGYSKNLESTNKEKLKSLFPECFSEGTLDIDKLLSLCGEYIDNDFEKYKFEWKGKSDCLRIAQQQSRGTLRPCPEESVNFSETENLYIEGDNLEVLKLLQTSYYNKVKMIYIDPPYNTGRDFIYKDKFGDTIANYKEITSQTTKSNPEHMGKYHTNWLNMMYPRLKLAHSLLKEDGVIFISIDDNEVDNLKKLCNEVFGEENFVDTIIWKKRYGGGSKEKHLVTLHEYVLMYCKNICNLDAIFVPLSLESINKYYTKKDDNFNIRGGYRTHPLEAGKSMDTRENLNFPIIAPDKSIILPKKQWLWSKEHVDKALQTFEIEFTKGKDGSWVVSSKQYLKDEFGNIRKGKFFSLIDDIYTQHGTNEMIDIFANAKIFSYPKPSDFIKKLLNIGSNPDDIILDFFSGSATTAHAVMQLNKEDGGNRKYIMVQLPELTDEKSEAYKVGYKNICEIGKERIRRAGKQLVEDMEDPTALDIGFKVLKLDTSNITEWDNSYVDPNQDYQVLLDEFNRRAEEVLKGIKPDRSKLDVIFEIMMKLGVPFHIPLTQTDINGKTMYVVGDFLLLICLESEITFEDVKAMCDEAPAMLVCGEKGFVDSCVMANIYYYLKEVEIELKLI